MEAINESYTKLREKIGDKKIEDFKTGMMFQMNFGMIVSQVCQVILPGMKKIVDENKLDEQ